MRAYSRSKLANILFTRELSRRLAADRVSVFALHPGVIRSGFARDGDAFLVGIGFRIIAPFITSPARGATTTVYLASEPGIEQLSGAYFVKGRPAPVSKWGADDDAARRLWDESEKLLAAAG
jgi:NAD(P)-dependent dehydrogenase (short-subunit alcohol dehydrogenase family)